MSEVATHRPQAQPHTIPEVNGAVFTDMRVTAKTEAAIMLWQESLAADGVPMSAMYALEDIVLYALDCWARETEV